MRKLSLATAALLLTMSSAAHAQLGGRDILARALKASGSDTVLARHKNMTMSGTFSLPAQGVAAPLVIVRASDNTFHLTLDIEGFGTIEQGYSEGTAYSIHPQTGTAILTGAQESSAKRQGIWRDGPDEYLSITNEGQEKYNGRDAFKVKMMTKDSVSMTRYYDSETYLPIATVSTTQTPDGPVEVVTVVSDYKNFGGMMLPTKQVQQIAGTEQIITVDKVEFDNAPATALALPAVIKALKK
jgi:hypothetical protein